MLFSVSYTKLCLTITKAKKSEFLKELNCKNVEGEIVNLNDKVMCKSVYLITGSMVLFHNALRVH